MFLLRSRMFVGRFFRVASSSMAGTGSKVSAVKLMHTIQVCHNGEIYNFLGQYELKDSRSGNVSLPWEYIVISWGWISILIPSSIFRSLTKKYWPKKSNLECILANFLGGRGSIKDDFFTLNIHMSDIVTESRACKPACVQLNLWLKIFFKPFWIVFSCKDAALQVILSAVNIKKLSYNHLV